MDVLLTKKRSSYQHNMVGSWPENPEEIKAIEKDHKLHQESLESVKEVLDSSPFSYSEVFVPENEQKFSKQQFDEENDLVVSIGGDGTALSSIDYALESALLPLRSSPNSKGVLCNRLEEFEELLYGFKNNPDPKKHTLAELEYRGQVVKGLNEVFVGSQTGETASYSIDIGTYSEEHQSSGIVFSTPRGSTGWYDSIMSDRYMSMSAFEPGDLNEQKLRYAVRELYTSPEESRDDYMPVDGAIHYGSTIEIKSKMNVPGKIILDGRSSKSFEFPRGEKAEVKVAENPLDVIC